MSKSDATNSSPQPQSAYASAISSTLYATYVVGISALMLVLNSVLCLSAHSALTLFGPEWLTKNPALQPRASQMFYFLAPVVLMVVEWNLLDRIQRLFSAEQT
ncbi:MAG: hypothetical protein SFV81_05945 [Pirellulaceae bacterium]|nr:hypothetical protein [Pirellulaceae bacterium]